MCLDIVQVLLQILKEFYGIDELSRINVVLEENYSQS